MQAKQIQPLISAELLGKGHCALGLSFWYELIAQSVTSFREQDTIWCAKKVLGEKGRAKYTGSFIL